MPFFDHAKVLKLSLITKIETLTVR